MSVMVKFESPISQSDQNQKYQRTVQHDIITYC